MCTVTLVPKGNNDFILTSNRDEAPNRISLLPNFYNVNSTELLFPKDVLSGGTWVGVSEKKRVVCVLNGGFKIHERKSKYRLSRGIIAKDFLISDTIENTISSYDLNGIEPFTIIIADWNTNLIFFELVWDEVKLYITKLPLEPKIWSSSTLYNPKMQKERLSWFNNYKTDNILNANTLLNFHKTAGGDNNDFGVIMNRGFVKTTSITQIEKENDAVNMNYINLQNKESSTKTLKLPLAFNE